ncbi:MAG TPA: hypothetical protein VF168_11595 [Trueperaceae bacterium]
MTSRPLYQAAVAELEAVLSPRVVSRSLKEGLAHIGATPEELDLQGLERILKGQVYRQLQVTMPIEQAKQTITELLERLKQQGNGSVSRAPTPAPLEGQQQAVAELKEALRPFNLYFEWPEVQKLRAQLQLLEKEQNEGREAGNLLRQAREQLRVVTQKLEDQLVIQAREIGELEVMVDGVRALGGPKLRRLENLLGQVREAQQQRQLASGEVERARRIGADLRKLLESSVLTTRQETPPDDGAIIEIDNESDEEPITVVQDDLEQEVHARLLQIDLESEEHELAALEAAHRNLLDHRPELADRVAELRGSLEVGEPLGERLSALREEFEDATGRLREELEAELERIGDDALRFRHHVDTSELSQAVLVARGVLESTLPALHDIGRIRDLHDHASRRAGEAEAEEEAAEGERRARLREQGAAIERMNATLELHRNDAALVAQVEALQDGLSALQAAHAQQEPVPELLAAVRRSEERLLAAAAGEASGGQQTARSRARSLLAEFEALPLLPEMRERASSISEKLATIGDSKEPHGRTSDQLADVEVLLKALRLELKEAYGERLDAAEREAVRLGEVTTVERIAQAREQLEQNAFPNLHEIEGALRGADDRRRQEELIELRTLELEATRFAGLGIEGFDELSSLLQQAALEPRSGGILSRAWLQLEALRSTVEQRLESMEGRLDGALAELTRVEKLNSEDVEEVRRILQHLDSQRGSLGRVSLGLRLELEDSLQHAEGLLAKLSQEYEATRAIADQLVSGNFIDDMLGLLGEDAARPDVESATAGPPIVEEPREPYEARSGNPKLDAWVGSYLGEEGVRAVALLAQDGRLVAGRLDAEPGATRAASHELMTQLARLGAELGRGSPHLATVEMGSLALITSRLLDGHRLVVLLESSSAMSRVLHKLRREVATGPGKTSDGSRFAG